MLVLVCGKVGLSVVCVVPGVNIHGFYLILGGSEPRKDENQAVALRFLRGPSSFTL
jgi:hypothetical protein